MGDSVSATQVERCRCNCGYTCGRQCGLSIMECMKKHYVVDCDHDFSAEPEDDSSNSLVCSKCGMSALSHDFSVGP
jgi:hypothetical protein